MSWYNFTNKLKKENTDIYTNLEMVEGSYIKMTAKLWLRTITTTNAVILLLSVVVKYSGCILIIWTVL